MIAITVYHRTRRELIVSFFAIERFFYAAVVFLAFLISLSVFEKNSFFIFFPIVAVISIKMSFVESELRQQHRISGKLIEIVKQRYGSIVYHDEQIKIVCFVAQCYLSFFGGSKIVSSFFKCVPHYSVSLSRPIERCRRSYSTVYPTVLVFYGDRSSLVREASVLHTASVEVFIRILF